MISAIHLILQALILLFGIAFLTIYDCHDFEVMINLPTDRICFFNRGMKVNAILIKCISIFCSPQISSHLIYCWRYFRYHLHWRRICASRPLEMFEKFNLTIFQLLILNCFREISPVSNLSLGSWLLLRFAQFMISFFSLGKESF